MFTKLSQFWKAPPRAESKEPFLKSSIDTPECRAAVHEAGHALLALRCTIVARVAFVEVHPASGTGQTSYDIDSLSSGYPWCALVIALGGLVAEGLSFGKFRTGNARKDLVHARDYAEQLVQKGEVQPPWIVEPVFPNRMFELAMPSISPAASLVLERGRVSAKSVLRRSMSEHARIVSLLLSRRRVEESDLATVSGSRFAMRMTSLFGGRFL